MIDTDKYKGHTPGPWTAEYGDYITHVTNSDKVVVASVGFELDKDGQLIADAPLLLAEIKDLRDRIERATKILCFDIQPENGPDYYLDLAHERSLQISAAADVLEGKE